MPAILVVLLQLVLSLRASLVWLQSAFQGVPQTMVTAQLAWSCVGIVREGVLRIARLWQVGCGYG